MKRFQFCLRLYIALRYETAWFRGDRTFYRWERLVLSELELGGKIFRPISVKNANTAILGWWPTQFWQNYLKGDIAFHDPREIRT